MQNLKGTTTGMELIEHKEWEERVKRGGLDLLRACEPRILSVTLHVL